MEDPQHELYLYFAVLRNRIHYAVAEWLWQVMKPALIDHERPLWQFVDDTEDAIHWLEDDVSHLTREVNKVEDEVNDLRGELE